MILSIFVLLQCKTPISPPVDVNSAKVSQLKCEIGEELDGSLCVNSRMKEIKVQGIYFPCYLSSFGVNASIQDDWCAFSDYGRPIMVNEISNYSMPSWGTEETIEIEIRKYVAPKVIFIDDYSGHTNFVFKRLIDSRKLSEAKVYRLEYAWTSIAGFRKNTKKYLGFYQGKSDVMEIYGKELGCRADNVDVCRDTMERLINIGKSQTRGLCNISLQVIWNADSLNLQSAKFVACADEYILDVFGR